MPTGYRFVVHGSVQGVGFRQATARQAQHLQLHGWVMNRVDGAVEGEVHHESLDRLAEFQRWLQRGPTTARVKAVEWTALSDATTFSTGFSIRR